MTERDEFRTALIVVTFIGVSLLGFLSVMLYAILSNRPDPIEVSMPEPRFMGLPRAPDCGHLYDVDRNRDWAACMLVPYRKSTR